MGGWVGGWVNGLGWTHQRHLNIPVTVIFSRGNSAFADVTPVLTPRRIS